MMSANLGRYEGFHLLTSSYDDINLAKPDGKFSVKAHVKSVAERGQRSFLTDLRGYR